MTPADDFEAALQRHFDAISMTCLLGPTHKDYADYLQQVRDTKDTLRSLHAAARGGMCQFQTTDGVGVIVQPCEFPAVLCEFHGGHDACAVDLMQTQAALAASNKRVEAVRAVPRYVEMIHLSNGTTNERRYVLAMDLDRALDAATREGREG